MGIGVKWTSECCCEGQLNNICKQFTTAEEWMSASSSDDGDQELAL